MMRVMAVIEPLQLRSGFVCSVHLAHKVAVGLVLDVWLVCGPIGNGGAGVGCVARVWADRQWSGGERVPGWSKC